MKKIAITIAALLTAALSFGQTIEKSQAEMIYDVVPSVAPCTYCSEHIWVRSESSEYRWTGAAWEKWNDGTGTDTQLVQDSILVRYKFGVEVDRDTIPIGEGGLKGVVAGDNVSVDISNPDNPVVSVPSIPNEDVVIADPGGYFVATDLQGMIQEGAVNTIAVDLIAGDLVDQTGMPVSSKDYGVFTDDVLSDNATAKTLFQELGTEADRIRDSVTVLRSSIPTATSDLANDSGFLTAEVDGSITNEIQDISTNDTPGNITLSDGSTLTLNVEDDDADATNEIQAISIDSIGTSFTITLSEGGGSVTFKVESDSTKINSYFTSILKEEYTDGEVFITERGATYRVRTYPEYDLVDSFLCIPVQSKKANNENLFENSKGFPTELPWLNLSSNTVITERDTIHPLTKQNSVSRLTLNATNCLIAYNNPDLASNYYNPDSTYYMSFWARKGAGAANSNVSIQAELGYSGNPDVRVTAPITDEFQYFEVELTALDASRNFNYVLFRLAGDVGDYVFITDPQFSRVPSKGRYYETSSDKIFQQDSSLYANYIVEDGTINYEHFRGIKGSDDALSINYLSGICDDRNDCNYISVVNDLYTFAPILAREGVEIFGTYTGKELSGSGNTLIQGTHIYPDLNDDTKDVFEAWGTSQIAGVGVHGFICEPLSPVRSFFSTGDALEFDISDVSMNDDNSYLEYGILFESGSLEGNVRRVWAAGNVAGFYGRSENIDLIDCKVVNQQGKGLVALSGAFHLESCWFEGLTDNAINFSGTRFSANNTYIERLPLTGTPNTSTLKFNKADYVSITNSNIHAQAPVDAGHISIELDSVTTSFISSNKFISGTTYIATSENTGLLATMSNSVPNGRVLIPEDWSGIADSAKVAYVEQDRTWFGQMATDASLFYQPWIVSSTNNVAIEGGFDIRSDTVNLVGTQNLVIYSEQLDQFPEWNDIGGNIDVFPDVEGDADLLVLNDATGIQSSFIAEPNSVYTIRYDAKIPDGSIGATIQPEFSISGSGDVVGETRSLTTTMNTYIETIKTGDLTSRLTFLLSGDSVFLTRVSVTEGYINEVYTETSSNPVNAKEVVFNGQANFTERLTASSVLEIGSGGSLDLEGKSTDPMTSIAGIGDDNELGQVTIGSGLALSSSTLDAYTIYNPSGLLPDNGTYLNGDGAGFVITADEIDIQGVEVNVNGTPISIRTQDTLFIPIYAHPHDEAITTGSADYRGWRVPADLNGAKIEAIQYSFDTPGSDTVTIQLTNGTINIAGSTIPIAGYVENTAVSQTLTTGEKWTPTIGTINGTGHLGVMANLMIVR